MWPRYTNVHSGSHFNILPSMKIISAVDRLFINPYWIASVIIDMFFNMVEVSCSLPGIGCVQMGVQMEMAVHVVSLLI